MRYLTVTLATRTPMQRNHAKPRAVCRWRQLLGHRARPQAETQGHAATDAGVVQTQIILSVVGAVIMLVVGASLARAFGIVGAANLIRYRSKIDDPKDAVVMLCALAVGLASGVGLYALAASRRCFWSSRSASSNRSRRA